jgi:uncharacterized membrane protein
MRWLLIVLLVSLAALLFAAAALARHIWIRHKPHASSKASPDPALYPPEEHDVEVEP